MAVKPIPEGYHALNPSLAVDDGRKAIDFYKRALGARERMVMPGPGGTVAHAELEVGDSVVMLADTTPQSLAKPPSALGGTSVVLFLYVEDVDALVQQACDAGATLTMPVTDMFWGDRSGQITDPFGHQWWIATHTEDVPPGEMAERAKRAMAAMGGG